MDDIEMSLEATKDESLLLTLVSLIPPAGARRPLLGLNAQCAHQVSVCRKQVPLPDSKIKWISRTSILVQQCSHTVTFAADLGQSKPAVPLQWDSGRLTVKRVLRMDAHPAGAPR